MSILNQVETIIINGFSENKKQSEILAEIFEKTELNFTETHNVFYQFGKKLKNQKTESAEKMLENEKELWENRKKKFSKDKSLENELLLAETKARIKILSKYSK